MTGFIGTACLDNLIKKSSRTFINFSITVVLFLFIPMPVVMETQVAGNTNFSPSVNENGGAVVSVDINVPKATILSLTPKLVYNSQSGNGLQGLGFEFAGIFQAITRVPKTLAQDGVSGEVQVSGDDRFALNGERLRVVSGIYGGPNSEYRTEQNSFSKIVAYGDIELGVEKFKVWTKDGLICEFGYTTDSRIEAAGTNRALLWLLNKVEDTNGNYYRIEYAEDNVNGEFRPTAVYYTGNSQTGLAPYNRILLNYENRSDIIERNIAGFKTKITKRLSEIIAYDHNSVFRRYKLIYTGYSGYSKLARVTEYGSDNSSFLQPVDFTWGVNNTSNYHFNKAGTGFWTAHGGGVQNNFVADYDGDGRSDFANYDANYNGGGWFIYKSTGSGFSKAFWGGHKGGTLNNLIGDFNGDGRSDLLAYSGSIGKYTVSLSNGSSFTNQTWNGHAQSIAKTVVGDFNGDGRSDIAAYNAAYQGGSWQVCISTGSDFTTTYWGGHKRGYEATIVADFNGDGKTDLAGFTGTQQGYEVSTSMGSSFSTTAWAGPWAPKSNAFVGDFNGDGMADLASYADAASGTWAINISTGKKFNQYGWIGHKGSEKNNIVGDFNGDGFTDLAGYAGSGKWHVSISTGSSFNSDYFWQGHGGGTANNAAGDYNGDGRTDIAGYTGSNGSWHVTLSNAVKEFITSVFNENGISYNFDYQPLTEANTYTKGSGSVYPAVDFVGALFVVKKFTTNYGSGSSATEFAYSGAKYDNNGRGFRGFSQIVSTNTTENLKTTTNYVTDNRCVAARITKQEVRIAGTNALISLKENEITPIDQGNGVCFSYYSKTSSKDYEINSGAMTRSVITTYAVDAFGNATNVTEQHSDGLTKNIQSVFANSAANWQLGRLSSATVTTSKLGKPVITEKTTFEYDANGNCIKTILLPGNSLGITTSYVRDNFGNIVSQTESGDFGTRVERMTYDSEGRNVVSEANALNHVASYVYTKGLRTSETDADGLLTKITYDAFGRVTQRAFPDGTSETLSYFSCNGNCPTGAVFYIETKASGTGTSRTYVDRLERTLRKETDGWGGAKIYVDTKYNADGTINAVSEPYFSNASPVWTTYNYDAGKRLIKETAPGGRVTTTTYNGLTTVVTNALSQTLTKNFDVRGALTSVKDHLGTVINYDYDCNGNPISLKYGNREIKNTYHLRGFKTSSQDPDMGSNALTYNALGLVTQQINNKGEVTKLSYDLLGRVVKREEPEGVATFEYDPANAKGELSKVYVNGNLQESYQYNTVGKLVKITSVRDGVNKIFEFTYNANGLPETVKYPDGTTTKQAYDTRGFLTEVRNATSNQLYWKADSYNQYGEAVSVALGNNLIIKRIYDANTGELKSIQTGLSSNATSVQNLEIEYNSLGNVVSRSDVKFNLKETFQYDGLNRLTKATLFRNNQQISNQTKTIQYDIYGNITSKSDVGSYKYGENAAPPNALTSINTVGVPNCIYPFDQQVAFTSFNYVSKVSNPTTEISFTYGANRDRQKMVVKKNGVVRMTKTYVNGIYEEVKDNLGVTTTVCYIKAGDDIVAYVSKTGNAAAKTTYLHTDHLGSVYALTNDSGQVEERYSYDAWGKQRNAFLWDDTPGIMSLPMFQRGFTFHESLDIDGLICMNARVYSPILGRFLSPDSFVQFPDDLQSLNRYAYVFNNPLSLTDPTGHFSWRKIGRFFKDNIGTLVGIAVGVPTGGTSFLFAVLSGAASGFGAAFTQSLVNGGNIGDAFKSGLQGAMWGAISAGLANGIAHQIDGLKPQQLSLNKERYVIKALLHGVAQGGIAEAQGGEFRQGFAAGAFSGVALDSADGLGAQGGEMLVIGTLVGGTSSVLSGGKFSNGALSGAFIAIYNDGVTLEDVADTGLFVLDVVTFIPIFWEFKPLVWGLRGAVTASKLTVTAAKVAVGPRKNWIRWGASKSQTLGKKTELSISWGASYAKNGKYVNQIGNQSLRNFNQSLRNKSLPVGGWRSIDPGHFHIKL